MPRNRENRTVDKFSPSRILAKNEGVPEKKGINSKESLEIVDFEKSLSGSNAHVAESQRSIKNR